MMKPMFNIHILIINDKPLVYSDGGKIYKNKNDIVNPEIKTNKVYITNQMGGPPNCYIWAFIVSFS
jgi:hypothetical protein